MMMMMILILKNLLRRVNNDKDVKCYEEGGQSVVVISERKTDEGFKKGRIIEVILHTTIYKC